MRTRFVPAIPVAAAVALVLTACGGAEITEVALDAPVVDTLAAPQDSSASTAALVKAVADFLDAQAKERGDSSPSAEALSDAVSAALTDPSVADAAAAAPAPTGATAGNASTGAAPAVGAPGASADAPARIPNLAPTDRAPVNRAPVNRAPAARNAKPTGALKLTSIDDAASRAANKEAYERTDGATDIGVSKDEILLGTVTMHGIALGNLLAAPLVNGAKATLASINDRGGVLGRRLRLVDCDDGPGEVSRSKACIKKMASQDRIFALLGYSSWASASVHSDLAQYKLPAIGTWAYSQTEWADPYMFPTHMSMIHEAMAGAHWVKNVIKPKTYGLVCLTSPEMQLSCDQVQRVLDASGAELVRKVDVGIAETSLSAQILAMRAANPDHIVHYVINPATMVKFMVEAKQQGYYPPMGISGNHLATEILGSLFGQHPVDRYWTNTTYRLWGPEFLTTMNKYARGNKGLNHHIVQASYNGALVFERAAKAVGPNLTRERLMAQLGNGDVYTSDAALDQKFSWNAAERGGSAENQTWNPNHGQGREFMYKYTSTNTVSDPNGTPSGFTPDPDQFVIYTNR